MAISNRSLITVAGAALDYFLQTADLPAFRLTRPEKAWHPMMLISIIEARTLNMKTPYVKGLNIKNAVGKGESM